jgi:C-terminal processing protease CtpA/Prc
MLPMVNGLDPLLGPAPFGSFRQPSGNLAFWVRRANRIEAGPPSPDRAPSFPLRHASLPVAVILGSRTGSSGEITATALIGRHGVRSFGTPTAGFVSSNETFMLADGAALLVTSAYIRDRTGHEYRGPLTPDEPTQPGAAVDAARHWLAGQCSAGGDRPQALPAPRD